MISPQGVKGSWLLFLKNSPARIRPRVGNGRWKKNSPDRDGLDSMEKVTSSSLLGNFIWKARSRHLLPPLGGLAVLELASFTVLGRLRA